MNLILQLALDWAPKRPAAVRLLPFQYSWLKNLSTLVDTQESLKYNQNVKPVIDRKMLYIHC
jgi:hypothetical protein